MFFPQKLTIPLYYYEEITDFDERNPAERLEAIGCVIMRFFHDRWKDNKDVKGKRPEYDYKNQQIINAYGVAYDEAYLAEHYLSDLRIMKDDVQTAIKALEDIVKFHTYPETED